MNKAPRQTLTAPIRRIRFVWVSLAFCLWVGAIGSRLVWLQVVQHGVWVDRAARQQQRTFAVAPRRGVLYDRNLRELAMTVLVDSVYAVPSELGENRASAAEMLAKVVHDPADSFTSQQQMTARFMASKNFAWVARRLDPATADRVRELNLKGIYFQKEFKRFYPNNDLAAQVLGYVGTDDAGLGGLEARFDDEMHGEPGHMLTAVDAKRHVLGSVENEPMPGENLVLSIDANIQYMAERALDAQMEKVKAAHGTVVVQDPHTGEILALAISPRFNPNDQRHMDASVLQNLAVSDVYEPGSTFKLVTYAAALDGAGVEPTDIVDCQGGVMTMYGRTFHDDKSDMGMHRVTVLQALEHSSDVGAAKMAMKLGNQKFYSYMKAFGFGERSGIELPSETRGLLRAPRKWSATSFMSLAIGQEIGVTPVQLAAMVSTIANGGMYMPPHVLLESTDEMKGDARLQPAAFRPSNQLPATLPDGAHRVITELTSAKMREMMRGIVIEGTGKAAALNGYSSGGKTGTAQKIDVATHTYSHTKLVASFAGMAPVSNPAITVAVVIDTPTVGSLYGATVSAPVFASVAQEVLEYLGVPHDQPLKSKREMLAAAKQDMPGDAPSEATGDLGALFAEVNNLPADDPLRKSADGVDGALGGEVAAAPAHVGSGTSGGVLNLLPAKVLAAFEANGGTSSAMPDTASAAGPLNAVAVAPKFQPRPNGSVVVDSARRVAVPSFAGAGLRMVVETAGGAGLRVEPLGSGLAREQVPVAGTMVPVGTEVVVRFTR
jgi:cell division protein FtsI (penicillin-binding protein 3)